jgi:protein-S-isoprenylcysteine O-methyltransferase Ste14
MTGWSDGTTMDVRDSRREELYTAANTDRQFVPHRRWSKGRSISVNLVLSVFYSVFAYSSLQFWLRTGSLVSVGLVAVNTLMVVCFLARRTPSAVTGSIRNWLVASLAQVLPLLLRPVTSQSWHILVASSIGQVLGLGIMLASLTVLNRSIGVIAANRGIRTRGIYSFVRHPLYAGEIIFFLSFLVANLNLTNTLLLPVLVMAQLVRASQEEALLVRDSEYRLYQARVPYRVIPGIF